MMHKTRIQTNDLAKERGLRCSPNEPLILPDTVGGTSLKLYSETGDMRGGFRTLRSKGSFRCLPPGGAEGGVGKRRKLDQKAAEGVFLIE